MSKKQKLLFATGNAHKLTELRQVLGQQYEIAGLKDLGIPTDIPETGVTLHENAAQKAQYLYEKLGTPCLAEDTGLEVEALDGAPGVYSARFAGPDCNAEENMKKLLNELEGCPNRKARFRTVIALVEGGEMTFFEGICPGTIARQSKGDKGFGYDPVFIPEGFDKTFAQMNAREKNAISHRKKAVELLARHLNNHSINFRK